MRIISDFKDYYDCVQHYSAIPCNPPTGDVKSVTSDHAPWIRKTTEGKYDAKFFGWYNKIRLHRCLPSAEYYYDGRFAIGFCGQLYLGYMLPNEKNESNKPIYCHCEQDIANNLQEHFEKRIYKDYTKKTVSKYLDKREYSVQHEAQYYFADTSGLDEFFNEIANEHPIFLLMSNGKVFYNPLLANVGFQRVIDPHTAFMTLETWMANNARPEIEIPDISDKLKAETHGFNQHSFRQDKGSKKEKRKANRKRKSQNKDKKD